MIQKKAGVFLVSLFLMVLLLGVVSAQEGCGIKLRSACLEANDPSEYIIMGLSGPSNAHGEVVQFFGTTNKYACLGEGCSNLYGNQIDCEAQAGCSYGINYDYVLCCNFGNSLQKNECGPGGYNILQLSSLTNAHAEIPGGTSYTTQDNHVCSQHIGADCVSQNPPEGYNAILSLSGTTNAHIGGPDDYDTKIYCQVEFLGTNLCLDGFPNGTRESPPEECDNYQDPHCTEFCECDFDYDYDANLNLCVLPEWGEPEAYWGSSETTDSYLWTEELYVGYTTIYMILKNSGLSQGTEVSFEIYERDTLGSQDIRVGADARKGIVDSAGRVVGNWTVSYTDMQNADSFLEGDEYEFYFKAYDIYESNELIATVKEAPFCPTIRVCMSYSAPDSCASDVCQVADYSVLLNNRGIDCANNPDLTCECWWDATAGTCNSRWGNGTGWCEYGENITEDCGVGGSMFLTYIFTADWVVGGISQGEVEPDCIGGSNVVPCPAQIQLPFFNIYNLIAIIVVIALIYFLLNLKKKKKKKK